MPVDSGLSRARILDADAMRSELTALASATAAPFNVNFFCHTPPRVDAQREARWRAALAPYYRELGIEPDPAPAETPGLHSARALQTCSPNSNHAS